MKKARKPYWEMSTAELRAATRSFDQPMPGLPGKPLTVADRERHRAARRRGRPRVGLGAAKIRISLEKGLLKKTDRAALALHVTRSELIAHGLRQVLASAGRL